jgi:hypothetical protein
MFVVKPKKTNLIRDYNRNDEPENMLNMNYSEISDKNIQLAALTLNIPLNKYKNYSIEEIERISNELTGREVINDNNIYYKKIVIAKEIIIEDKRKNKYNNEIKEKMNINKIVVNTINPNTKLNEGLIIDKLNNMEIFEEKNNIDLNTILNKNKNKNNMMTNNINNNKKINNNIKINNTEDGNEILDYDILSDPRAQNVDRRILNDKFKKEEDYDNSISSTYIDYNLLNKQKRRYSKFM